MKPRTFFRNIFSFVLGLGLVLFGVHQFVPMPDSYGLRDRFSFFKKHKDEYDAIFVGSSRIARGIVPAEVDAVFRDRGYPLRTINLGHPAMGAYETDFYLRKVLSWKPARLKWVFIELDKWNYATEKFGHYTDRFVFWHSPAETRNVLESPSLHSLEWKDRLPRATSHLLQCAWKLSSYGKGPEIVASLLGWSGATCPFPSYLTDHGGYRALEDETDAEFLQRREEFLADPEGYETLIRSLSQYVVKTKKNPKSLKYFNVNALKRQMDLIESAGAGVVFIAAPTIMGALPSPWIVYEQKHIPNLLDYTEPAEYPFLYDAAWHYDTNHISREAAHKFSRLVANDIIDLIDTGADG